MTTTSSQMRANPAAVDHPGRVSSEPVIGSGWGGFRVSVPWLAATVAIVAGVAVLAPSALALLGFLGIIILAHEAGHLLVARRSGMVPTEYFWGFGPEVMAFDYNGCRYGLRVAFVGGYVRLEGMTPTSELPEGFDEAGAFRSASHGGRLATILAGPATNLVLAYLALLAAETLAGAGPVQAITRSALFIYEVITATLVALWMWVANMGAYIQAVFGDTSSAPVRFLSPVTQAEVSQAVIEGGVETSLYWFAVLSCAVGVLNLLPLPPLDGSHALAATIDWVSTRLTGRRVSFDVRRLVPLAYATIGLLVILSATAMIMDLRDLNIL